MKINKKLRNLMLAGLAALTISGTALDLPFGVRAFRKLEDKTFVGLNLGFINEINNSYLIGASVGGGNILNDNSNVYGANVGVLNRLDKESRVYGANVGVANGLNDNSNVYGASVGGGNILNDNSNVYGANVGVLNRLDKESRVYGVSGILNLDFGDRRRK